MPDIDTEFRLMLDLFMASDPNPLSEARDEALRRQLDRRARRQGYSGWVEAYHYLPEGGCRKALWSGMGAPAGHCGEPAWGSNYTTNPLASCPMEWNHAHGKKMPVWPPLKLACPRHGGPPDPRTYGDEDRKRVPVTESDDA